MVNAVPGGILLPDQTKAVHIERLAAVRVGANQKLAQLCRGVLIGVLRLLAADSRSRPVVVCVVSVCRCSCLGEPIPGIINKGYHAAVESARGQISVKAESGFAPVIGTQPVKSVVGHGRRLLRGFSERNVAVRVVGVSITRKSGAGSVLVGLGGQAVQSIIDHSRVIRTRNSGILGQDVSACVVRIATIN